MFLRSTRPFHTTRAVRQVDAGAAVAEAVSTVKVTGKKKAPKKQNLVILNASQSRLVGRKKKHLGTLHTSLSREERQQLQETSMMLNDVPIATSTPTEINQAISMLRPDQSTIPEETYRGLSKSLKSMFTLEQLKAYLKSGAPEVYYQLKLKTADAAIKAIFEHCWQVRVSQEISMETELIVQRSFDLTKKQMFLLLSQQSIIMNWVRANVKIFLFAESLQMIVRAPEAYIQYIELALASIFKNIKTSDVDLGKVRELFALANERLPLDDIQTLTGVFFEQKKGEDGEPLENEYTMSSLGSKKFDQARRLILWSLDYNPFTQVNMHVDMNDERSKLFRHCPDTSLPWIHRNKEWVRLREPRTLLGLPSPLSFDSEKLYEELYGGETSKEGAQTVTAVSFGELLFDKSTLDHTHPKTTMSTDIPRVNERIHKLPLFDEVEDPDVTVDNHLYYAQIRLVPSPFNKTDNYMTCPPVEFWLETDQDNRARVETLQVLSVMNERHSTVSLPSSCTDAKFVRSDTQELIEPFDVTNEDWLADQPGIKRFIQGSVLDFSGAQQIKVPKYCEIILPGYEEPVRYDYVHMTHRKQIDLRFKDRLLTCAVLEGGSLGGRTSEVIMVGKDEEMTKEEFEEFVGDTKEFIESLVN